MRGLMRGGLMRGGLMRGGIDGGDCLKFLCAIVFLVILLHNEIANEKDNKIFCAVVRETSLYTLSTLYKHQYCNIK